jgi:hypothetical protein
LRAIREGPGSKHPEVVRELRELARQYEEDVERRGENRDLLEFSIVSGDDGLFR